MAKSEPLLVAVYGSLRQGLANHRLLATSELLGTDLLPNFKMYSLGAYPYITEKNTSKRISVEVYGVTSEVFSTLDRLEGYPSFYDRKQVETKHGCAWIYYINHYTDDNHERVENGDWVAFVNTK